MQEFITFLQNHWLLSATFFIATAVLLIVEFIKQKQAATQVSPSQLTQMINHQEAVVIDLRSEILYKDGHIIDAQSIPYSEFEAKAKKLDKYKTKPIILVCQIGTDSAKAETQLRGKALNIHILAGGMRSWREAEMPIVKG